MNYKQPTKYTNYYRLHLAGYEYYSTKPLIKDKKIVPLTKTQLACIRNTEKI
jgi:hypothetical protein